VRWRDERERVDDDDDDDDDDDERERVDVEGDARGGREGAIETMGRVGRASTRRGKVLPVRAAAEEHDRGGVFAGWEDVGEHARRSHGEIDGLRDGEDDAVVGGAPANAVGGAVSSLGFKRARERVVG